MFLWISTCFGETCTQFGEARIHAKYPAECQSSIKGGDHCYYYYYQKTDSSCPITPLQRENESTEDNFPGLYTDL